MKCTVWVAGAGLAALAVAGAGLAADPPAAKTRAGQFALLSTDLSPGGRIAEAQVFNSFGCQGGNLSPALSWSGAPAGTRSFALMEHDPDAPTGSGWWHWVVYDIPAGQTSLAGRRRRSAEAPHARRRGAGSHRLRHARLRRAVPAAGQAPSLLPAPVRAQGGQARSPGRCDRGLHRLHGAQPGHRARRAHGNLWPLAPRASGARPSGRGC